MHKFHFSFTSVKMWKKQNNEYVDVCNGPGAVAHSVNPPSDVFIMLQTSGGYDG